MSTTTAAPAPVHAAPQGEGQGLSLAASPVQVAGRVVDLITSTWSTVLIRSLVLPALVAGCTWVYGELQSLRQEAVTQRVALVETNARITLLAAARDQGRTEFARRVENVERDTERTQEQLGAMRGEVATMSSSQGAMRAILERVERVLERIAPAGSPPVPPPVVQGYRGNRG